MPESQPPIDLSTLGMSELEAVIASRSFPPVDTWQPEKCGHSAMRIARDGTWYHEGNAIRRPALVRLFSTVLRREADGRHVLVTPVEKLDIEVEGTAFRAVGMKTEGEGEQRKVALLLDSGDAIIVGPNNPLRIADDDRQSPRVAVRHGLEAELARPVYYELAEIALAEGRDPPGFWSAGMFFPLAAQ